MTHRLPAFLLCLIVTSICRSQISPLPGAKLNYNQIMFECEKIKGPGFYVIQLSANTTDTLFGYNLLERKDSSPAMLISNLQFGQKYRWRYTRIKDGQKPVWQGPYLFEISAISMPGKNLERIIVSKNDTSANAGGFIINDGNHCIIDRAGKPVWYLPNITWRAILVKKKVEIKPQILDLRLNAAGTITYLADSIAVECDLNGHQLWKGPNDGNVSGMGTESYNHDFKRLPNGHYMILGNEIWRKLPDYYDTVSIQKKYHIRQVFNNKEYAKVEFGTVIEYDKNGKVVWSWNSQDYFDPDALKPWRLDQESDWSELAHINAFSVDKNNDYVYVGFRNINRVVKVEKKTGKVVDSWGQRWPGGEARKALDIHRQHDANLLRDNTIAVFNSNDFPGSDSLASVVIFSQQPVDTGCVIWQFNCDFDSIDHRATRNGGNVDELKNGNLFVCTGNMDRIFEVTRDKKIVWQAMIQGDAQAGKLFDHRLYRAHWVSSLYPCYFTFQTDEDTVTRKSLHFGIRIFNKGSEEDAYRVKVASASGLYSSLFTTAMLNAESSAFFEIKPDKPLAAGDKINISISSKTNPDLERHSWVVVAK